MAMPISSILFSQGNFLAYIGVAIAMVFAGIGSAKGVGIAGEAGTGVLAEDPTKFGKVLILSVLPGTQGLYGFVISIIVLIKMGVIGGAIIPLTMEQGMSMLAACIPVGVVGLLSAIAQGRVVATGMMLISKRPNEMGKVMVSAALVEFYSILGLLISFLIINALPLG